MRRTTVMLLLTACNTPATDAPDCGAGQLLIGGACRDLCNNHGDCTGSLACVDGVCGPPCSGPGECGPVGVCGSGTCVCPAGGCPLPPPPCLPGTVQCVDESLVTCDAAGQLVSSVDCGAPGCNDAAAPNRCNQCTPGLISCASGAAITCAADGTVLAEESCNDGNACTADDCLPTIGCTHQNTCACDVPADCDDGNPCTDDLCDGFVCANPTRSGGCDDGDRCTAGDTCLDGTCRAGAPIDCGANASCTSDDETYSCACDVGFFGATTTGASATCEPAVIDLGSAETLTSPVTLTLSQPVPAGALVVAVAIAGNPIGAVSDSQGNTWQVRVDDSSCGQCGGAAIFTSALTHALAAGDTVTVQTGPTSAAALWLLRAPGFPFLDQIGDDGGDTTATPTVTTSAAILDPVELVVGAFATRGSTTLVVSESFTEVANATSDSASGLIAYRQSAGLVGPQALQASSSSARRFSGVIATFYGGTPEPPTGLALSHTANRRGFTVGWTGGRGNGGPSGCQVQVATSGGFVSVSSVNCDATTTGKSVNLPLAADWYGGAWASTSARLVRVSDGAVLGTFSTPLSCSPLVSSSSPTPTIDEDCDGTWDDHTCTACSWVSGTIYDSSFTACTNSSGVAATFGCDLAAENVRRYTNGTVVGGTPTTTWSSDMVGTACQGSYTGAVTWTCTCTGCTYN